MNELRRPGVPPAQPIDEADGKPATTAGATPPEETEKEGRRP